MPSVCCKNTQEYDGAPWKSTPPRVGAGVRRSDMMRLGVDRLGGGVDRSNGWSRGGTTEPSLPPLFVTRSGKMDPFCPREIYSSLSNTSSSFARLRKTIPLVRMVAFGGFTVFPPPFKLVTRLVVSRPDWSRICIRRTEPLRQGRASRPRVSDVRRRACLHRHLTG